MHAEVFSLYLLGNILAIDPMINLQKSTYKNTHYLHFVGRSIFFCVETSNWAFLISRFYQHFITGMGSKTPVSSHYLQCLPRFPGAPLSKAPSSQLLANAGMLMRHGQKQAETQTQTLARA